MTEDIQSNPPIHSLGDFIDRIVCFTKQQEKGQKIWYRGQASSSFKLIPNLYREILEFQPDRPANLLRPKEVNRLERSIDASFSRQANSFLRGKGIHDTEMNRYFLKQHYKIKTRLLDWTESALTALYFALEDQCQPDAEAVVYMLLPFRLNSHAIQTLSGDNSRKAYMIFFSNENFPAKNKLFNESHELRMKQLLLKYYTLDVDKGESLYPIAIYPPYLDERMAAQQSCFTLFGNIIDGMYPKENGEEFLCSLKIDAGAKEKILNELRIMGYSEFSVYPDMTGLGNSINAEYRNRFDEERLADSMQILFDFFSDQGTTDQESDEDSEPGLAPEE